MKAFYEEATLEVIRFRLADVIRTSDITGGGDDGGDPDDGDF